MDGDIKKEASLFGKKEYESLFEYTPSGTEKPDIIDERASIDDWSSIKAKSQRIQETNPTNRLPYPWEQPESETYFDSPSTKDPKPYVKISNGSCCFTFRSWSSGINSRETF